METKMYQNSESLLKSPVQRRRVQSANPYAKLKGKDQAQCQDFRDCKTVSSNIEGYNIKHKYTTHLKQFNKDRYFELTTQETDAIKRRNSQNLRASQNGSGMSNSRPGSNLGKKDSSLS